MRRLGVLQRCGGYTGEGDGSAGQSHPVKSARKSVRRLWMLAISVKSAIRRCRHCNRELVRQRIKSRLLLLTIQKLFVGNLSPKNLSGPLGIAKVAGDSAEHGLAVFCRMLAILGINLGVVNLLPIPVLDGGLLLLYLIELPRQSVPEKVQLLGSQMGMTLIVGLMLFAIYNDLLRL